MHLYNFALFLLSLRKIALSGSMFTEKRTCIDEIPISKEIP